MKNPLLLLFLTGLVTIAPAQQPNIPAQREAMKKLDFLIGQWSGEATVTRSEDQPPIKLMQTGGRPI